MPALTRYSPADFDLSFRPSGITFGDGKFWLTEFGNENFYKYTSAGVADGTVRRNGDTGAGGCTFYNSKLYTVSSTVRKVRRWALEGGAVEAEWDLHSDNTAPHGIAFLEDSWWVTDYNTANDPPIKLFKYTETGTYVAQYDLDEIEASAGLMAEIDTLWVGDRASPSVAEHDKVGKIIYGYDLDAANSETNGICTDDQYIYTADSGDNKVYAYYNPYSGIVLKRLPDKDFDLDSDNARPRGISFFNGRFWVVGEHAGAYSYSITESRNTNFSRSTLNNRASGCTIYDNLLWVCDYSDRKVYVYDNLGNRQTSREFNLHADNTFPNGITSGPSHFYVVDANKKVFLYNRGGNYILTYDIHTDHGANGIT